MPSAPFSRRRKVLLIVPGIVAFAFFLAGLVVQLMSADRLEKFDSVASVVSAITGFVALVVTCFAAWWGSSPASAPPPDQDAALDAAAEVLARRVREQWVTEVGVRRQRGGPGFGVHFRPATDQAPRPVRRARLEQ